jgi:predicted nucleotide-binding protein
LYDSETSALQDALNQRLEIQKDYYKQERDVVIITLGLYLGLLNKYCIMDLYSNMQQVGAQAFSSLTDMIVNGPKPES